MSSELMLSLGATNWHWGQQSKENPGSKREFQPIQGSQVVHRAPWSCFLAPECTAETDTLGPR